MDKKIMCLLIAMWIFYISAVIVGYFSTIAYWVLLGLWLATCIATVVVSIIEPNKEKKRLEKNLDGIKEIHFALSTSLSKLKMDNMDNLEVMATKWYGKVGIIKAKDKITNEIKIYIGEGWGLDEQQDIQNVLAWGTKYTPESFKELVDWLENK